MAEFASLKDALQFAADKEGVSVRLYSELAQKMEDPVARGLLEDLAAEEADHRGRVELELIKLGHVVDTFGLRDRPHVVAFDTPELAKPNASADPLEILQFAIRREEAAFRMYVELLADVTDSEIREALIALAEEEVRHKLRFEKVYEIVKERQRH